MPEGHSIRRIADVHWSKFGNKLLKASSPQGRFADGAMLINEKHLTEISTHGKHLFLHFDERIVHVHLGLYGWFTVTKNANEQSTDSVRMRLSDDNYTSELTGPTACDVITLSEKERIHQRLGPDPLRDHDDPELAWVKIHKSKKTIGELLMDQSVIAGIGNVYRAELLFISKLNPYTLGNQLERNTFDEIWNNAVRLLKDGSKDGRIRAVEQKHLELDEVAQGGCAQTSYAYKREGQNCRICNSIIKMSELKARRLYWCAACQVKIS